jgi:SAM-dependent methyltransferase
MTRAGIARSIARRLLPRPIKEAVVQGRLVLGERRARRAYDAATPTDTRLGLAELEMLAGRYPVPKIAYRYDPDALLARGVERARFLLTIDSQPRRRFLEIGTSDGMTLLGLKNAGRDVLGIDIVDALDPRARAAGVALRILDATHIDLPADSFDVVYSFNAFEHLPDPAKTFEGIGRVLAPGGLFYLSTGSLGWSPHGAHLYDTIGVPYVAQLFDENTIQNYLTRHGLHAQRPWYNNWPIEQYRAGFAAQQAVFETLQYRESRNRYVVDLIAEFPAQFRRAPSFDSLLVEYIEALFRKHST